MNNKYKIIKDPKFGFYRADPIPTQNDVNKYYLEEFYSSNYKSFNNSSLEVQKKDKEFFDSRWESMYDKFLEHFKDLKGKSLFDIGFGFAQALIYFKDKGLDVSGIEPSPEGVEYAKSQGLNVYQGGVEDFELLSEKKYDIVTLTNVLEHLRNPYETLINIKEKLLKKNGILFIDVPNEFNDFQTIADKEYNLKQWWICPPNHINYFNTSTLVKLLEKSDYNIISKESTFPVEIFMLFGDVYVGNSKLGKECHNKRLNFEMLMKKYGKENKLKKLYETLADLNLGRNVILYCTPKNKKTRGN